MFMAPLHYKNLEVERNKFLVAAKSNYDVIVHNNPIIRKDLLWWKCNILNSKKDILPTPVDITLYSDASMKGWGGHTTDNTSTGGDWNEAEQKLHINTLELKAAFFTLQCFCSEVSNVHVRLMMDNTSAIACVNNFGSMKLHLLEISNDMFAWALSRDIYLTAGYIPGKDNVLADKESRTRNLDAEWQLKKKWFDYIVSQLGAPDIDLFASRINKQLDRYVSWRPDPHAQFIDAFSESWSGFYAYIFPPFSVMARVLRKLSTDAADAIVVFPNWPSQIWYPRLLKMQVGQSFKLPWGCLTMPQQPDLVHPLNKSLNLRVCRLSGVNMRLKD